MSTCQVRQQGKFAFIRLVPLSRLSHYLTRESSQRLKDYPIDPYQMRVHDTTTSIIFSKYGTPIHSQTLLELIAEAQYQVVQEVIAAHGDGPVLQPHWEWSEKRLYLRISRPLAREYLTWLMLADTLEGLRNFFDDLQGWFETSFTILDDTAGPVGEGIVTFGR